MSIRIFQVSRKCRDGAVHLILPGDFAGFRIDRIHDKAVFGGRGLAFPTKIKSLFGRLDLRAADHGGEKNAVSPNDRRRPAEPWDFRFPGDVLGSAPGVGKAWVVGGNPRGTGAAKLRPVGFGNGERQNQNRGKHVLKL
jgi:hypothetical protein